MDLKKKKLVNIPESKGLLHNFKFSTEIPFAPLSFPKTLYYQLDPERHTRARTVNAEVKSLCNLLVTCDLGLAIDDLNMKPHVYNLQSEEEVLAAASKMSTMIAADGSTTTITEATAGSAQLHEDDLALINEDIVVSDTEEDEETLKIREEQRLMEERIKQAEQQKLRNKEGKPEQRQLDQEIDYSHSFDTLRIAIHNTFTAQKHSTLETLKHPVDPSRKPIQVFELFPTLQTPELADLKLGVIAHKQRIEAITTSLEKGKFTCFYKDDSFQDKNQKLFRLFQEKMSRSKNAKVKTTFEEDGIVIDEEYAHLFEEDQDVIIEETEAELIAGEQMRLKNKSVFVYSDHSSKLQANDAVILFERNCEETHQKALYQKMQFQFSLDQEKRELTMNTNAHNEVPRYVTMDIVEQAKLLAKKKMAAEQIEEEGDDEEDDDDDFEGEAEQQINTSAKKGNVGSAAKSSVKKNGDVERKHKTLIQSDEDDDMDDYDDDGEDELESIAKNTQRFAKTKSYNLRDTRKTSDVKPVADNVPPASLEVPSKGIRTLIGGDGDDDDESLDDIFGDDDNPKITATATVAAEQQQSKQEVTAMEEEEDDEFDFSKIKTDGAHKQTSAGGTTAAGKRSGTKKPKDDFIDDEGNDDDESPFDESSDDDDSVAAVARKNNNHKVVEKVPSAYSSVKKRKNVNDSSSGDEDNDDPEEFPL